MAFPGAPLNLEHGTHPMIQRVGTTRNEFPNGNWQVGPETIILNPWGFVFAVAESRPWNKDVVRIQMQTLGIRMMHIIYN